ncbi:hypothetical protein PAEPH01_2553 [Pancytospora epiphaga]|nr:hypothetical protein PAEPH01_2553 [Pancytospora epiphaga]
MENSNPSIKEHLESRTELKWKDGILAEVDIGSVFEIIRDIKDPEHPYSLEQLNVVSKSDIFIDETEGCNGKDSGVCCTVGLPIPCVTVIFTPTVPHCSMASMIGLCIIHQLRRYIRGYWIRVYIKDNMHSNWVALNKQLNDKDRVLAALENEAVVDLIDYCVSTLI